MNKYDEIFLKMNIFKYNIIIDLLYRDLYEPKTTKKRTATDINDFTREKIKPPGNQMIVEDNVEDLFDEIGKEPNEEEFEEQVGHKGKEQNKEDKDMKINSIKFISDPKEFLEYLDICCEEYRSYYGEDNEVHNNRLKEVLVNLKFLYLVIDQEYSAERLYGLYFFWVNILLNTMRHSSKRWSGKYLMVHSILDRLKYVKLTMQNNATNLSNAKNALAIEDDSIHSEYSFYIKELAQKYINHDQKQQIRNYIKRLDDDIGKLDNLIKTWKNDNHQYLSVIMMDPPYLSCYDYFNDRVVSFLVKDQDQIKSKIDLQLIKGILMEQWMRDYFLNLFSDINNIQTIFNSSYKGLVANLDNYIICTLMPAGLCGLTTINGHIFINEMSPFLTGIYEDLSMNEKEQCRLGFCIVVILHEIAHFLRRLFNQDMYYKLIQTPESSIDSTNNEGGNQIESYIFGEVIHKLSLSCINIIIDADHWKGREIFKSAWVNRKPTMPILRNMKNDEENLILKDLSCSKSFLI
jgi:hypothetical protein